MDGNQEPTLTFSDLQVKADFPYQKLDISGGLTYMGDRSLPYEDLSAICRRALRTRLNCCVKASPLGTTNVSPGCQKYCLIPGRPMSFSMCIEADFVAPPYDDPEYGITSSLSQRVVCRGLEGLENPEGLLVILQALPLFFSSHINVGANDFRGHVIKMGMSVLEATRDSMRVALELTDITVRLDQPWRDDDGLIYADLIVDGVATNVFGRPVSVDSFPRLTDGNLREGCDDPRLTQNVEMAEVRTRIRKESLPPGATSPFSYRIDTVLVLDAGDSHEREHAYSTPLPWRWHFETGTRYDGMPCRFSASGDVGSMIEDAMRAVLRELGEGENDHEDPYSKYATYVSLRRGGTYYVAMSDTAYAFHTNSSCQRLSRSIVTSVRINDREAQYRYFCPVCSHW